MLYPTTITSKWQMTIPKDVRELLGIRKPGKTFIRVDEKKQVIAVTQPPSIFDLAGTFKPKRHKGVSVLKAREYMQRHYERT
mgnify:CR=1 FL=1